MNVLSLIETTVGLAELQKYEVREAYNEYKQSWAAKNPNCSLKRGTGKNFEDNWYKKKLPWVRLKGRVELAKLEGASREELIVDFRMWCEELRAVAWE